MEASGKCAHGWGQDKDRLEFKAKDCRPWRTERAAVQVTVCECV